MEVERVTGYSFINKKNEFKIELMKGQKKKIRIKFSELYSQFGEEIIFDKIFNDIEEVKSLNELLTRFIEEKCE